MSFTQIAHFIKQKHLIKPKDNLILGLSGGPDSIFLFYFLLWLQKKIPFTFIAAHLDHGWRKSSAKDALFCKQLCEKYKVPFISAKLSQLRIKIKKSRSKEDRARQYRRFFFEQLKEKYKATAIALAHTQDDQIETFFIRLIRGTTVSGLACMRPQQGDYIRPLLQTNKKEILSYLKRRKIKYVTDPTNVSTKFLRNRIRLELIPTLQKVDKRAERNILKTISSMQETEDFLHQLSKNTLHDMSEITHEQHRLNIKQFLALDSFLQKRVILAWLYEAKVPFTISTGLIEEIIRFIKNKKSATHQFDLWQIKKSKHYMSIHHLK